MTENARQRQKNKVIAELVANPIIESACRSANLPRSTYYRWLEEDAEFEKSTEMALAQGRDRMNDIIESQLIKKASSGEFRFLKYWLDHNHHLYVHKMPVKTVKKPFKSLINKLFDLNAGEDLW